MAIDATNARQASWERAIKNLDELNQKLVAASGQERDALERAIAEQEEDLLDTPACDFRQVHFKLELLFSEQLNGLDPESEARRLVLEDLEGLITATRHLLGEAA
jgi:hypothetical protein